MYTRETQIMNLVIQFPNQIQPINGIPLLATTADIIRNEKGEQVGHPIQNQRFIIGEDFTPEFVEALNSSLAFAGYKIVPIAEE